MERVSQESISHHPSWVELGPATDGGFTSVHRTYADLNLVKYNDPNFVTTEERHYTRQKDEPLFLKPDEDKGLFAPQEVHKKRGRSLRLLALIEIFSNHGPTEASDTYLERAATVYTTTDVSSSLVPEQIATRQQLTEAHILHSDTQNRFTQSAADSMANLNSLLTTTRGLPPNSPYYGNPESEKVQRDSLIKVANNNMTTYEYVQSVMLEYGVISPDSPNFSRLRAEAYIEYASTLQNSELKIEALKTALQYSSDSYNESAKNDSLSRNWARYVHAKALHDIAYVPGSLDATDQNNDKKLRNDAHIFSPFLIALACEKMLVGGYSSSEKPYPEMAYFRDEYFGDLNKLNLSTQIDENLRAGLAEFMEHRNDQGESVVNAAERQDDAKIIQLRRSIAVVASSSLAAA